MAQERRTFRFIHTADLHLDSPLELRADSLINQLGGATRQALARLVDLCIDETVDALLIAGDLFDGEIRTAETVARLTLEMRRLRDAGIRVFIIYGNHDRKSGNEKSLELPDNVHVFAGRGTPVEWPEKSVTIHGVSFMQRHVSESLLPKYKRPSPDHWNIGLMHTSIDGSQGHDDYAPCALSDLIEHGYDYWALGHIHKRKVHNEHPAVVMPGIPQGRHINEAGACSVSLVTLTDGQRPSIEERSVRVVTFDTLNIDLTGCHDRAEVLDRIDKSLSNRAAEHDDTTRVLRLVLTGSTEASFALHDAPEQLKIEVDGIAERHDDLTIEKIKLKLELSHHENTSESAYPIDALFADAVVDSPAVKAMIDQHITDLKKHLPAAYKNLLGDEAVHHEYLRQQLLDQGIARVTARLAMVHRDED